MNPSHHEPATGQYLFPWGTPAEPDHGARSHHPFGPSKLNAYAACAGYQPKSGTSVAAEEGTALHEFLDRVALAAKASGATFVETLDEQVRGEKVGDEEYGWMRQCCEQVDTFLSRLKRESVQIHNEIQLTVRKADDTVVNYGHVDLLLVWDDGRKGMLYDWKFGWIAVPPSSSNYQGMNYALGALQQFPDMKAVGVMFVQPKLKSNSAALFTRDDMEDMLRSITEVIDSAQQPNPTLAPNPYCDYCLRAGTCSALAASAHTALTKYEELPFPATFGQLEIKTPEDAAKALYVIGRLETHFEAAKGALRQMLVTAAKDSDGTLSVPLPGGDRIVVEARQRSAPRSLQDPAAVSAVLSDVLTPQQVLSCCDISLGKLEGLFADMLVAKGQQRAGALLEKAQAEAAKEGADAKELLDAAQQAAKDLKVTKKEAKEIFATVLSEEGLLTAGAGKVDYLKVRLEKSEAPLLTK